MISDQHGACGVRPRILCLRPADLRREMSEPALTTGRPAAAPLPRAPRLPQPRRFGTFTRNGDHADRQRASAPWQASPSPPDTRFQLSERAGRRHRPRHAVRPDGLRARGLCPVTGVLLRDRSGNAHAAVGPGCSCRPRQERQSGRQAGHGVVPGCPRSVAGRRSVRHILPIITQSVAAALSVR